MRKRVTYMMRSVRPIGSVGQSLRLVSFGTPNLEMFLIAHRNERNYSTGSILRAVDLPSGDR